MVGNNAIGFIDYLGQNIIGCGSVESLLKKYGVSDYKVSNHYPNNSSVKRFSGPAKGVGSLESEILFRMIGSGSDYSLESGKIGDPRYKKLSDLRRLELEIQARVKMVKFQRNMARNLNFIEGEGGHRTLSGKQLSGFGASDYKPRGFASGLDQANHINNNPSDWASDCSQVISVMFRMVPSRNALQLGVDDQSDWVPGDAGYITNGSWEEGQFAQSGQNIVYLGNGEFYGHRKSFDGRLMTGNQWWTHVNEDWEGKGKASLDPERRSISGSFMSIISANRKSLTPVPNTNGMKNLPNVGSVGYDPRTGENRK